MRRLELLITHVRKATENITFSENTGISDSEFIEYANEAQERIVSLISSTFTDVFLKEKIVTVVPEQEAYGLPSDLYLKTRIQGVEYSATGRTDEYYRLNQRQVLERFSGLSSNPQFWIIKGDSLLLEPKPQSAGSIRINYQFLMPRVDIRRATVLTVSLNNTNKTITSLTFDSTINMDTDPIVDENYMTIVDKFGVQKMKGIIVDAISTTTGIATIDPTFVFESGETIDIGDFALVGNNSTTHSQLTHTCERFITTFMKWKIFKRDSSVDTIPITQELDMISNDIIASYATADQSIDGIPIISGDYFPQDDW